MSHNKTPPAPGVTSFVKAETAQPVVSATLDEVFREARQARRLLDSHLQNYRQDQEKATRRQDAIMGLLREILTKLPG